MIDRTTVNSLTRTNSDSSSPQEQQPQGFLKRTALSLGARVTRGLFELTLPGREYPVQRIVRKENEMIDWRQAGHEINIFRQEKLSESETLRLTELKKDFLERLEQCHSISERFGLFMNDDFAKDIYTLDLGETQEAGSHEAVEAIKNEYRELESKLVDEGVIDGEQPRSVAKRTVHFAKSSHDDYFQVTRNRTLFCFEHDGRKISVSKRMTFLLDKTAVPSSPDPLDSKHNGRIHIGLTQKLIDSQAESVVPVRTVYFAVSKKIKQSK